MVLGVDEAKRWLTRVNDEIHHNKGYLTNLDQAIGDGDHGINMARGFNEVQKKLTVSTYADLGGLCKDIGMTLLSKVGGASGPLYGTIFLKMSGVLKGCETASIDELTAALDAGLKGIEERGKAKPGDKTMIDVWQPFIQYLQKNGESIDWDKVIILVKEKTEFTKEMEAKKGRAAYLGKRSIGHIDPGAASSNILLTELAYVFKGEVTS